MKNIKNIIILIFIFFTIIFNSNRNLNAQITRGTSTGEILISSTWYYLGGQDNYDAIFYSSDYGNSLVVQYAYSVGSNNMPVGKLTSDVLSGTFYNNVQGLWISNDNGLTWTFVDDIGTDKRYTSGASQGEIYKYCKNPDSKIYRSTNFGQNFQEVNSGIFGFPEIGTQEGEIYLLSGSTWPTFNIDLLYSSNYGSNFETIYIDSLVQGNYLGGNFPVISRGTNPGEIYLISWHLPGNYHIYYSSDHGQIFNLKYISEECDFYFENYYFTAGKGCGEFYAIKQISWYDGINTQLEIYHSEDTAQNFNISYHILDETTPVTTVESNALAPITFECFPNPFFGKTTFSFQLPESGHKHTLNIFGLDGNLEIQFKIHCTGQQVWDGKNKYGQLLQNGIYFYSININGQATDSKKMTIMK